MQLQNYYYWFKDAIPHHVCDDIVRYAKSIKDQMAVTGGLGNRKLNKKTHIQEHLVFLLFFAVFNSYRTRFCPPDIFQY